jgi:hypothetical protein
MATDRDQKCGGRKRERSDGATQGHNEGWGVADSSRPPAVNRAQQSVSTANSLSRDAASLPDLSSDHTQQHFAPTKRAHMDNALLRICTSSLHSSHSVAARAPPSAIAGNPHETLAIQSRCSQNAPDAFRTAVAAVYASELQSALLARDMHLRNLARTIGANPSAQMLSRLLQHHQQRNSLASSSYPSIVPPGNRLSSFPGATVLSDSILNHDVAMLQQQQRNALFQQQKQQQSLLSTSQGRRDDAMAHWTPLQAAHTGMPAQEKIDVQPPFADSMGLPVKDLPVILCLSDDSLKLSEHQVLLRQQIEVFRASEDDIATHTRGRNKPIAINQVGIRCRHCAHLPISKRQRGCAYFPATTVGLYQAAQNMSTTHIQCGLCSEMPESLKTQFAKLLGRKNICSGAGRKHWAKRAEILGLLDTDDGIRFHKDTPRQKDKARHPQSQLEEPTGSHHTESCNATP